MSYRRGFIRIGIVLTTLWLVIAPFLLRSEALKTEYNAVINASWYCSDPITGERRDDAQQKKVESQCRDDMNRKLDEVTARHPYARYLAACVAGAIASWLLLTIAFYVLNWIWRGFRSS